GFGGGGNWGRWCPRPQTSIPRRDRVLFGDRAPASEVRAVCVRRWVALDYASCGAAAGRPGPVFETGGHLGPKAPAQLSQYAASPIRYGQPAGAVACPLG